MLNAQAMMDWIAVGFLVAGAMNWMSSRRASSQSTRRARVWLAISCLAWAVATASFRHFSSAAGYTAVGVGCLFIIVAAIAASRRQPSNSDS
ncbi:MAG: hypothetical protein M1330_03690 [Armatimonadetes bacterium]|nr:hypothetical protein [Armatimonadota bacterium]